MAGRAAAKASSSARRWRIALRFALILSAIAALGWAIRGGYPPTAMAAGGVLAGFLCWVAALDAHGFIVPDTASLGLIPLGLGATWLLDPASLMTHAVAAVAGGGLLLAVALIYRRFRGREGLGLGDIKLFAAAGAWLGPEGMPGALLLGSFAAIAVLLMRRVRGGRRHLRRRIAFAPFLAIGIWTVWVFGPITFG
ncbi:A24 family peptidase [Breoghania sp.]|uniref:prepilin peptidase n=1 Tax=Breoghania sp. TaxID=2065378 RepID=UPI0029C9CED4|nr:A24 family peptidase [Breoghania sp.]